MVYDPIRDCDVPSPAASMHNPSPWADMTPGSDVRHTPSAYPPQFQYERQSDRYSPGPHQTPGNLSRSVSGGLRGLLNDEEPGSRRSSGRDSFSSAGYEETPQPPPRSRITHLVHESATPLSQSSSHSSMGQSAVSHHSHHSPVKPYSLLDHDGFLAPVTPASAYPRPSRSPYSLNSPSGYPHAPLPQVEQGMNRSPYPHMHDQLPLRSPSISVSPRQYQQQSLPPPHHPHSRPGSSSSAGGFAFNTPHESPSVYQRQLSADYTSRPRSGSKTTNGPPSRRPSTGAAYQTGRAPPPPRSPSPPPRLPYAPHHRISRPTTLLEPLPLEDLEQYKAAGLHNNPLRRADQRPPPSWSGPSPSPGLRRASGSHEADNSYFPNSNSNSGRRIASDSPGPSAPKKRKTSDRYGKGDAEGASSNGGSAPRQKMEDKRYMGNVGLVADHYNSRQEVGKDARELSPIIGLRKFNNWIKSVLIGKFAHRPGRGQGANVLDIGCGKGGDLMKWKSANIRRMVALDIAAKSIEQAQERYNTMRNVSFQADFIAHDCYGQPIGGVIPPETAQPGFFDNVSMQFCMHYAFESPSKVRMMLENVTRYLRVGGRFVGTIPDSDLLLQRLNDLPEEETAFGNRCYSVRFAERRHKGVYGHAYNFFLEDAVEDVPEYIVDWDNFISLASEYGLRLVYRKAFNEILSEEKDTRDFGPLLSRMGVINQEGVSNMDEDQWEAANLYMAFALEKYM